MHLIVATRSNGPPASGKIIKEMSSSVASGTPIFLLNYSWMRNVLDKIIGKNKTHFMFGNFFFLENVRVGQTTDFNIKRRMRIACWITKATDTHSEYVILIVFHSNIGYANAPQCYIIPTFPVLYFVLSTVTRK